MELPGNIDLKELKLAIDYLTGVEAFHLVRSGEKKPQYDFDISHFKAFMDWLRIAA